MIPRLQLVGHKTYLRKIHEKDLSKVKVKHIYGATFLCLVICTNNFGENNEDRTGKGMMNWKKIKKVENKMCFSFTLVKATLPIWKKCFPLFKTKQR